MPESSKCMAAASALTLNMPESYTVPVAFHSSLSPLYAVWYPPPITQKSLMLPPEPSSK